MKSLLTKIKSWFGAIIRWFDRTLPRPKKITLSSGHEVQPPRNIGLVVFVVLIIIIIWFGKITEFDITKIFRNAPNFFIYIYEIFHPSWDYFPTAFPYIVETIQMAILGTAIGAAATLPVAILISSNISKNGKVFRFISKALLSLLRTFPILVYAAIIVLLFKPGSGGLIGTIALSIFTFSILTKMLYEYIETVDLGAYEAIMSTGVTKSKAFTTAVFPEVLPVYYSFSLYALDINIRYSAVLGYVGAGGIGYLLRTTLQSRQYGNAGLILIIIFTVIFLIEYISKYIRKRLA